LLWAVAHTCSDQLLQGDWEYDLFLSRDLKSYLVMTVDFMAEFFPDDYQQPQQQ
jgi:hypothetical protein